MEGVSGNSRSLAASQVSMGCRVCDIVASLALLLVFFPLILLVSIVGLALYGRRTFTIVRRADGFDRIVHVLQFSVAAPTARPASLRERIGGFMVRSRLYALPELVAVLAGSLSLFGAAGGRPILFQK